MDWFWRLRNKAFKSDGVSEDCYNCFTLQGERIECSNNRGISLLSLVGKIYAGSQ